MGASASGRKFLDTPATGPRHRFVRKRVFKDFRRELRTPFWTPSQILVIDSDLLWRGIAS